MYDMNDLFNSRDVVGCKLNQIIGSHKYTKSNVWSSDRFQKSCHHST